MDMSKLHIDAIKFTLELLEKGAKNVLESVRKEYSSGEKKMSEGQWELYNENVLPLVLEQISDDDAVKGFLSEFPLLENTLLGYMLDDYDISVDNISFVIDKITEECLKKACNQDYNELISSFLSRDRSLANFRFMDGSYVLLYAAQFGSKEVINALLYYGAVTDCEDQKGQNILHYAARNPSNEVWDFLTNDERFARLMIRRDAAGQYPIELVERI